MCLVSPAGVIVDRDDLEAQPLQEGYQPVETRVRPQEQDEDPAREASGARRVRPLWRGAGELHGEVRLNP